jgi:predicted DNA-binding transcriptional regulator YafY
MTKLEQRMSDKERAELASFGDRFVYMPDHGTKSYAGKEDIIDAIQTGILSRNVVRYRYADSRGRVREGFLAPFGMVLYRHGLYAIGARLNDSSSNASIDMLAILAIERFTEAEHLRERDFALPGNFVIRDALHGAFGPHLVDANGPHDVVVEFSGEKALLASSRLWHPTQRIDAKRDGRVRIAMHVPSLAPVVSWILEWGPHARAIAPDALVAELKAELEQARAQYQ